jgi:prophage regulatory protein
MYNSDIPSIGFLRVRQILGNRAKNIPPIIPISRTTWWAGVKAGKYPQPIKLGPNITAWKAEDIHQLIEELSKNPDQGSIS